MHGEGTLFFPGGVKAYEGGFLDDRFHGFGHLCSGTTKSFAGPWNYKDLSRIEGYWIRYEGDFYMDKRHGYGIIYMVNGEKWAGQFK